MQIEMLKATAWDHVFYEKGDGPKKTDKLPEDVKQRWVNRKIAKLVGGSANEGQKSAPPKGPTFAELREIAKELEIEGYGKMKKDELLAAIPEAEAAKKAAELEEQEKAERLAALSIRAEELGIEGLEEMGEEELAAAIDAITGADSE